ncbi:MAG: 2-amino-4-hydroxy-6-hydroxymethyldihydropteridine diphosphokinase [Candidatus Cloacimonetes bacterium]|nr:2-amino-4-hydroxy-6-hydroxymethyldihydropteridine diphosphokinase [Candidatus Cloacimonadota bacterium]
MSCYLGIGSNLGKKAVNIRKAIDLISKLPKLKVIRTSTIITTKPFGKINQPDFKNCVLELKTEVSPTSLLKRCLEIEEQLGRIRKEKWGPRIIDIDILLYNDEVIKTKSLILPHPGLHKREFVLISLNELCPDLIHPILKKSIKDFYREIK